MTTTTSLLADDIDLTLADRVVGNDNPTLAFNAMDAKIQAVGMQYIDAVRMTKWTANVDGVKMGYAAMKEAGYVGDGGAILEIPEGATSFGMIWPWAHNDGLEDDRAGTYVLSYEGEGELELGGDAVIISQKPGEIIFESEKGGNLFLMMESTDPNGTGDYLRDFSMVREEHVELHEAGAIWNPDWINLIEDVRQLRFMGWQNTNHSTVETWGDYSEQRIADMVSLANQIGVDPWFCMPHMADEEFIRNFATYVRDNLDPDLQVRVEYSNETWNFGFTQTKWLLEQSQQEWGENAHLEYYAKMAVQSALIWEDVFGDEADDRLINVIGTQASNIGVTSRILNPVVWAENEPDSYVKPKDIFDELAITSYFGSATIRNANMRSDLLEQIKDPGVDAAAWLAEKMMDPEYVDSIPYSVAKWKEQAEFAEQYGLDLVGYEGGQHMLHSAKIKGLTDADVAILTEFMSDFVRSEAMGELYEAAWHGWAEVVDNPFMQFGDVDDADKYGAWGLYESLDDSTPRSEMLEHLNDTTDPWWDATGGVHYQNGVTVIGTDEAEMHIGTSQEDFLIGKGGDDIFILGLGDDGAHGGDGLDTVAMRGAYADYTVTAEGDGFRVVGPEGSDFLIEIEKIQFSSGEVLDLATMLVSYEEGAVIPEPTPDTPETEQAEAPAPETDVAESTSAPVVMEQEAAPKSVALVSEMGEVELSADGGLRISGINVHSALGRELGLVSGGRDYVIYEKGATAEIDGKTIGASYWSTQDAKSGPDGESLGASALDVALKFGTVVVGATSAMVGSAFGDTYSGRATDDHFDGAAGHDYISGRDGNDLLIGGSGDDKLLGGIGDDTLSGGAGNDMIDGGDGLDTLLLSGALADYWVAEQANGDLTLFGAEDTDTLRGIEQVQFDDGTVVSVDDLIREEEMLASIKMTSLAVSSQGDLRDAALNSDVSFAEAESGLNIVGINKSSLLGRDVALGEARGYVVHERGVLADTGDKVVGANYWSLQDNAANRGGEKLMDAAIDLALMLGSVVTNVNGAVIGSDFGDKFMGRNTDDIFFGGGGSDQIFADYGNDIVAGGAGNDLIIGGRGYDTALFSGEAEDYTLYNKNGQLVIKGNDGHDRLREIERLQFEDGAQFELADIVPETLDADWNVSLADYTPTSYAESDMLFV